MLIVLKTIVLNILSIFLVASGGRVTLVPFFCLGPRQESEKLILAILDID